MNNEGDVVVHRNRASTPECLQQVILPYGTDIVIGVGEILSLVILYEIEDIHRFPNVGNFISYCHLVKCAHESAGKRVTGSNNKSGNTPLKGA